MEHQAVHRSWMCERTRTSAPTHASFPVRSADLTQRSRIGLWAFPAAAAIICQKGKKLSEGVAAFLRHQGVAAETLEGGFEAWLAAGLPTAPEKRIAPRDQQGRSVWVTPARPKIDRIACPWLIRRLVDS